MAALKANAENNLLLAQEEANKILKEASEADFTNFYKDLNKSLMSDLNDPNKTSTEKANKGRETILEGIIEDFRRRGYFESDSSIYLEEDSLTNSLNSTYDYIFELVIDPVTNTPGGVSDSLEIKISPTNPSPGEIIKISLSSFSTELDRAYIEWTNKGKVLLSGIGEKTLSDFIASQDGSTDIINIYVRKFEGGVIERVIKIVPSEIDIIYEANTQIPPFYSGKSNFTHESMIKIIAMPRVLDDSGIIINHKDFKYTWSVNDKKITEYSGIGKNTLFFESDFITESLKINLEVEHMYSDFRTSKNMALVPQNPMVLNYEVNPIFGIIFDKSLPEEVQLDRKELTIKSFPYFFNKNSFIDFSWFMNDNLITQIKDDKITVGNETEQGGSSLISLRVSNLEKRLQSANTRININLQNEN
jgi:hypothetical protein